MDDLISRKEAVTLPVMPVQYRHYQTMNLDDVYEQGWEDCQKCIKRHIPASQQWIPCSERLPEEHDSFMNKFYGTDKFKPGMFRRLSNKVIVTERFPNGETQVTDGCTHDGKWWFHSSCIEREVIAWMPLPEPYTEDNLE